ncbi:MAG: hypothetical protein VYE73_03745 [Acidobacteriota bacterium]|nr:hypothetical protein [Acidobacteriota bacterium]
MTSEHPIQASEAEEPLEALDHLLAQARVGVQKDFSRRVMEVLPDAPWGHRTSRSWLWVAAVAAGLVLGATLLLAGDVGGSPAGAIADLFVTTLSAGAGFLAASWSGIGSTVDAALGGSLRAILGLGAAAAGAYGLLFGLVRRRRRAVARR